MAELVNSLFPFLVLFLLVVYLAKLVVDMSHRVLRLELRIEELLREIERLRDPSFAKQDTRKQA
jgi:hypothetical protein